MFRRAFSLIELLAVLAIVGAVGALVLVAARHATRQAKEARARAELAVLAAGLEAYRRSFGDYPHIAADPVDGSAVSGTQLHSALSGRRGPLPSLATAGAVSVPLVDFGQLTLAEAGAAISAANHVLDPWGQPYHYAYFGSEAGWTNSRFVLYSADPGLLPGGYPDSAAAVNRDNLYADPHR